MSCSVIGSFFVFILFEVVQWQFKIISYKPAYHLIHTLLLVWVLFTIVRYIILAKSPEGPHDLTVDKLYNATPLYPLRSKNERRAACAESLYLIGETANSQTSISYINSLEQLDMNNREDVKEARLLMRTLWNIDSDRSLRKQLHQLMTSATACADISLATLATKERYITFLQRQGLPFQNIDACPMTGYDLVRASWLARMGFSVGYLEEQETRDFINTVGELIDQQYASWEQLTASYLIMYLEWNGGLKGILGGLAAHLAAKESVQGAKLLLEDNASPFRVNAFPLCTGVC